MISLLVPSRNGSATLPAMLDSLASAASPTAGYELIFVDNGSTDGTSEIVKRYEGRIPLTFLHEPTPGKNVALNLALERTRGNLIVFTDDDAILPENFLRGYESVANRESKHSVFGGHIVPQWESAPSPTLLAEIPLVAAYTATERERERGPIDAAQLFGPSMAVRRSVIESGIRFDPTRGPSGNNYVMGGETDFLRRVQEAGFSAFFEPAIEVRHIVPEHHLSRKWLARRAFKAGRAMVHDQLSANGGVPDVPLLFGYPRWAIREYMQHQARMAFGRMRSESPGSYSALWKRSFLHGYVVEHKAQRTGAS